MDTFTLRNCLRKLLDCKIRKFYVLAPDEKYSFKYYNIHLNIHLIHFHSYSLKILPPSVRELLGTGE